jgi:hypothetical protein
MQVEVAWKADGQQFSAMLPCLCGSLYQVGLIQNVQQRTVRSVEEESYL